MHTIPSNVHHPLIYKPQEFNHEFNHLRYTLHLSSTNFLEGHYFSNQGSSLAPVMKNILSCYVKIQLSMTHLSKVNLVSVHKQENHPTNNGVQHLYQEVHHKSTSVCNLHAYRMHDYPHRCYSCRLWLSQLKITWLAQRLPELRHVAQFI